MRHPVFLQVSAKDQFAFYLIERYANMSGPPGFGRRSMCMDSWLKAAMIFTTALLILVGAASADQVDENENIHGVGWYS